MTEPLPFGSRLWLAFACFFRVLFDGVFARRVHELEEGPAEPEPPLALEKEPEPEREPEPTPEPATPSPEPALQLLALFQREGRLVDFLQQDVSSFDDADIGAAARVVHDGCKKALDAHATIEPVRKEEEGASVTIAEGFDAATIKLTGNVAGDAPYGGVLRHRGWRATKIELPRLVGDHDARILAPAEIEL